MPVETPATIPALVITKSIKVKCFPGYSPAAWSADLPAYVFLLSILNTLKNLQTQEVLFTGKMPIPAKTTNPVLDYTSFRTVQLVLKGNTVFAYVDNKLIVKMPYIASQQSKKITNLMIYSQLDKIECDRMRLLNSFTKKVRMKEEFNKDGQSNPVFY